MKKDRFQLVQALNVVEVSGAEKGRTVTLPKGTVVEIIGPSAIPGCIEMLYGNAHYNVFEEDLRNRSKIHEAGA